MNDTELADLIREHAQLSARIENLEAQLVSLAALYAIALTLLENTLKDRV